MRITQRIIRNARAISAAGRSVKEFAKATGVSYAQLIMAMNRKQKDGQEDDK